MAQSIFRTKANKMNKIVLPTCVLFLGVLLMMPSNSQSDLAIGVFKDPAHPGKCVLKSDVILDAGQEIRNPDTCGRIICGEGSVAELQGCGVEGIPDGCKFGDFANPEADYPDCCKRIITCI